MVKGNAAIEIFMKHKFIFSYDYLNEIKNELSEDNKYNIYYVLKGHRYIIRSFNILNLHDFIIIIGDLANNSSTIIPLNIGAFLQLPDMNCVELKIVDNGSMMQVDFTSKGMNFLNAYEPQYVENNKEIINKYGHMRLQFHAKTLFDLFMKFQNKETEDEYELLYIGQTQKSNIYDRLYSHNTIPEIMRYQNREDDREKYELYIMVTGVHIKFIEEYNIKQYLTNIITSNTLQDDFLINSGLISKSEVVDIAEAMLILYFKPKYNDKLKNTKNPEILCTYSVFNDCLINPIAYALDLYFEDNRQKIILKTDTVSTKYKQNLLKCEFDENGKVNDIILEHNSMDVYL